MIAVRFNDGVIRMLIQSYLIRNSTSRNMGIITYKGELPPESVWTRGELPNTELALSNNEVGEIVVSSQSAKVSVVEIYDLLLWWFPLGSMRAECLRIHPPPYDFCWVGRVKNDNRPRPLTAEDDRYMFRRWNSQQLESLNRLRARLQHPGHDQGQRALPSKTQTDGRTTQQSTTKPTGTC